MAKLVLNFILSLFLLYSVSANFDPLPFSRQFVLPSPAFGPDSVGFTQQDPSTAYVSVSDGRVLKLNVNSGTFKDFSYTSPQRNKVQCDGNVNASLAPICGKVFGLSVDSWNQLLYLVDPNLGLFYTRLSQGGPATFITNTAGGQPFKLLDGIDVDPTNGDVYFTDASQTLDYRNITPSIVGVALDSTGRLIKYSRTTRQVTVLLTGLSVPTGPAVSVDGTFVLIPEIGAKKITKYYIKGPKAKQTETLLHLPGVPFKIKRASTPGDFWVPVIVQVGQPAVTKPIGYKFNSLGIVQLTKDLSPQYPNLVVAAIQETNPSSIYVASRLTNYITQYY